MITVVCWLFQGHGVTVGGKPTERGYEARHVTRLQRRFSRWYSQPHRYVCITDMPDGLEGCEIIPMPSECVPLSKAYRKLWLFSQDAADLIAGRVFFSDLDSDFFGDLGSLLDRSESLVLWHDKMYPRQRWATSHYLLDMGSHTDVWDEFLKPGAVDQMLEWYASRGERATGSDQAWMSYYIEDAATFGPGLYRARLIKHLPEDAKIVTYPGAVKPWHRSAKRKHAWLR